jgi:hypothetical protein
MTKYLLLFYITKFILSTKTTKEFLPKYLRILTSGCRRNREGNTLKKWESV